ncbi:hypothetical protein CLM62_30595 [Streptomyces sp. SA15]|uniref:hypothetical protein n=1 Tax=Streptomyces sp. SA15 TaxID=934019 RepID=UPI000BAEA54F|nr:hypothetical protein [Streptomyces sp. SA15]PAZ12314.1 hypothetical protein CLM62_30595 [Streptomyces sp. SA15]
MLLKAFDSVRLPGGVYLVFQRIVGAGATSRTWYLSSLSGRRLSFTTLVQTRDDYYGPAGHRPPGLWKRVLRAVVQSNGLTRSYYCPDLPPSRLGIAVAVPRYLAELRWEGCRWNQAVTEHLKHPCPACTAAGWRPTEDDAT